MKLRKLEIKDKPFMQEWMRDKEIMGCFQMKVDPDDEYKIEKFINDSFSLSNRHYAITDEWDEYQGTISLKNIDLINKNAEYAIVMRKCAMGSGLAKSATEQLLNIAFNEMGLHKIYLNVLENNYRAIKFYERLGFCFEGEFKQHLYLKNHFYSLKWYAIIN